MGPPRFQFSSNPLGFTTDAATQGAWNGKYGGEGYLIANGPAYLPPYAAVSTAQATPYTWAPLTSDPRALQNGVGATSGIASAFYGNNFNVNVTFTDSYVHRVALYLLDFDTSTRSETITIINANTGAVLDTRTLSGFRNGLYATWNLQGNVRINVKDQRRVKRRAERRVLRPRGRVAGNLRQAQFERHVLFLRYDHHKARG